MGACRAGRQFHVVDFHCRKGPLAAAPAVPGRPSQGRPHGTREEPEGRASAAQRWRKEAAGARPAPAASAAGRRGALRCFGPNVPAHSDEVLQAMDLHVQRGTSPERAGVLSRSRLGTVRLPSVAGARSAAGRPDLCVRCACSSPTRWLTTGPRLPWSPAYEPAAAARLLGTAVRPSARGCPGGPGLALPLPGACRRTQSWPYGRVSGRVRPSSGLQTAVGSATGRAALLRCGRTRGLQRHRLASRAAHGAPVDAAPGAGLMLPSCTATGNVPGPCHGCIPHAVPRGPPKVAAAKCRLALRSRLLRYGILEAVLPGHLAVRDPRDDSENTHPEQRPFREQRRGTRRVRLLRQPQGRRRFCPAARKAREAVEWEQQRRVLQRVPPQVKSRVIW